MHRILKPAFAFSLILPFASTVAAQTESTPSNARSRFFQAGTLEPGVGMVSAHGNRIELGTTRAEVTRVIGAPDKRCFSANGRKTVRCNYEIFVPTRRFDATRVSVAFEYRTANGNDFQPARDTVASIHVDESPNDVLVSISFSSRSIFFQGFGFFGSDPNRSWQLPNGISTYDVLASGPDELRARMPQAVLSGRPSVRTLTDAQRGIKLIRNANAYTQTGSIELFLTER